MRITQPMFPLSNFNLKKELRWWEISMNAHYFLIYDSNDGYKKTAVSFMIYNNLTKKYVCINRDMFLNDGLVLPVYDDNDTLINHICLVLTI